MAATAEPRANERGLERAGVERVGLLQGPLDAGHHRGDLGRGLHDVELARVGRRVTGVAVEAASNGAAQPEEQRGTEHDAEGRPREQRGPDPDQRPTRGAGATRPCS